MELLVSAGWTGKGAGHWVHPAGHKLVLYGPGEHAKWLLLLAKGGGSKKGAGLAAAVAAVPVA